MICLLVGLFVFEQTLLEDKLSLAHLTRIGTSTYDGSTKNQLTEIKNDYLRQFILTQKKTTNQIPYTIA